RDNPPALATDVFLGFEQAKFAGREYPELFAAKNTTTNQTTGSPGAETYTTSGVVGSGTNNKFIDATTAQFIYHDPQASVGGIASPPLQYDAGTNTLWAKT